MFRMLGFDILLPSANITKTRMLPHYVQKYEETDDKKKAQPSAAPHRDVQHQPFCEYGFTQRAWSVHRAVYKTLVCSHYSQEPVLNKRKRP